MSDHSLMPPEHDPAPIFELFRGSYGSELLTAAVTHFNVFGRLTGQPLSFEELQTSLDLAPRPANVLVTALRAMGLLTVDSRQRLTLTAQSREHLVPGSQFDIGHYIGLAAASPGVLEMVQRLRTNKPAGADADQDQSGTAFIYRDGVRSAMEAEESARHFTLALAGRARNVAPVLADRIDIGNSTRLVDVGGGTGIYSFALQQKHPQLKSLIVDRPEVLKLAAELADEFGVADRTEFVPADMFVDALPGDADITLLSNVLHDWDVPECQELVRRCSVTLKPGGRLLIHDVFLNEALDGPLPIALYSAALFTLTEGRAYSANEYRQWMLQAGLIPGEDIVTTIAHCGVLSAMRPE